MAKNIISTPKIEKATMPNIYERILKRAIDILFSLLGMILLSWVFLIIAVAIYIDDPGPVFFSQRRVGKGMTFFNLHKFRSMKKNAPHDVPTHLLHNPQQYNTRIGRIIRKYSLDELPQIWDIFTGKMSIIGPRPALWNQDDLVAERDRYGANDVMPGLTGWAQINGRDKLEIPEKARLDGEYVFALRQSSISGFLMDLRCFFGSFIAVLSHNGYMEDNAETVHKKDEHSS